LLYCLVTREVRTMIKRRTAFLAVGVLAIGIAVGGCGQDGEGPGVATAARAPAAGSAAGVADADEAAQRYGDCLRDAGVTMIEEVEGPPRVDKERTPITTLTAAAEKCRQLAPVTDAPAKLSAQDLEKRRRQAACLREHGVPEYPDPDPDTGEPAMTDTLAQQLKTNPRFSAAMEACRGSSPASDSEAVE
jgi:hypothetical protein